MKAYVLYCSLTGNTEKIARKLARDLNCPVTKVEPDILYGGYLSAILRVAQDKLRGEKPGTVTEVPDLSGYDTVLLGYPVWYGTVPEFMQAFLKQCDLGGKKLIPFATFGAADITGSLETLAALCPDAEIASPFNYGVTRRENYREWLKEITE